MLRFTAVLLLFVACTAGMEAGEPLFVPHGASEMGIAFSATATPGYWSCFNNQALLTGASGISVSTSLETRFLLSGLSSKALGAVIAITPVPLGIVVTHYGNSDYHRMFCGLCSAVTLTKGISLGVQVDYVSEKGAGDYRDVSHITFETGMTFSLSPSLTAGMHVFNPLTPLNSLPSAINAAIQWKHYDDLFLTLGSSKISSEPLSVQCGISWEILDRLVVRSGYMSSPSSFSFGVGFRTGSLQIDAGFLANSVTGITSSVSLTWIVRK
jgi:hypothetical protein